MIEFILGSLITAVVCWIIYAQPYEGIKTMNIDYFEYAFKKYPEKSFALLPPYTVDPSKFLLVAFLLVFGPLLWILFNVEEFFKPALLYVVLCAFVVPICLIEWLHPELEVTGLVGWGGINYDKQILIGLLIGFTTVLLFLPKSFAVTVSIPLVFFILIVAPIVEEMFFGNLIPASLIESMGWVGGSIITSISFAVMHWLAYSADAFALFAAFCFRLMCCIALVKFRSFLPGLVAHTFVNIASLVSILG